MRKDTAPAKPASIGKIAKAVAKFAEGLATLEPEALDDGQVTALKALRDQIDALLNRRT